MSKWFNKRNLIKFVVLIALIIFFLYIVPISLPILFAVVTAMLLEPLIVLVCNKFKWSRKLAVISVFILFMAIISSILYFTITQLIGQAITISKLAPNYLNSVSSTWIDLQFHLSKYTEGLPIEVVRGIQNTINDFLGKFQTSVLNIFNYSRITGILAEIPNFLVSLLVYLIALFLVMLELPDLKHKMFSHLSTATAEKVRLMTNRTKNVVFGFMKAQVLVSFVILGATLIGLFVITPKYAIVMSIVIWIIDIIPILGSIVILAPWAIYHFISGDSVLGTKLAILAAILLIIRRTVEPKVMGSQIGLSPLATLIAMFLGLKIFGFLGFFIGPLFVILFTTAREAGLIKLNFKL